jgi:hypothetical protein
MARAGVAVVGLVVAGCGGAPEFFSTFVEDAGPPAAGFFKMDAGRLPPRVVWPPNPLGPEESECATQSIVAERLPLGLTIMMDSSGSMLELTASASVASQTSKWEAATSALTGFFNDRQSAGLSVALQYFPILRETVPASCLSEPACGAHGPCLRLKGCLVTSGQIPSCGTSADCGMGQTCEIVGSCDGTTSNACFPSQKTACGDRPELCKAFPGVCEGETHCDPSSYATPEVAAAPLPGGARPLVASLTARKPRGLTPTAAALAGALTHARSLVEKAPDERVAVLLVTDGLPTVCKPRDIASIASMVRTLTMVGGKRIPLFVIGVFAEDERQVATQNLNALARAGGTPSAYVLGATQHLTSAFKEALNEVRAAAFACEYRLSVPNVSETDFGKVNVQFTSRVGQRSVIYHVKDQASCHPTLGGWYYDKDPMAGTPQTVTVCDKSCEVLRADARGRVDIVLGCKTVVIP